MIRDGIKSKYVKADCCAICDDDADLELHHYHTVSLLVKKYAKELQLDFNDEEVVLSNRDGLYQKYMHELTVDTVTLCHDHHVELHSLYTQEPSLGTVSKQRRWVANKADQFKNPDKHPIKEKTSRFARFLE